MFLTCLLHDVIQDLRECLVCVITVSLLLLAHSAQEMPEWERWEISGAEQERKAKLRECPDVLILTGSSLCQSLSRWLRKLFVRRDPSIHPHKNLASLPFRGTGRGNQTFFAL